MTAPSYDTLFRVARDELLMRNPKLSLNVVSREGTDLNALTAANAAVGDELSGQLVRLCASLFIDTATKEALDRLVFDLYGLVRKPASAARGSVQFWLTASSALAFSVPVGTRLVTSDGRQFVTTESANFASGSIGPVTVAVRSTAAGLSQQVAAYQITNIIDSVVGAPSGLLVTNPFATVGADDEELDEDLRERARSFFSTVQRGTLAAIEQRAKAVAGVRRATAFEVLDSYGRPAKAVQLILADAFTDALVDTASSTYAEQSQVLASEVFSALFDTRPAGMFIDCFVAQTILQSVVLALSFEADADIEDTALRARAAAVNMINRLAPGAVLMPSMIVDALKGVAGLIVGGGEVLSPAGTVSPGVWQVLRTTMGLCRVTTAQADRALQGTSNPDAIR